MMKCNKCNKTYQSDCTAISVGNIKICIACVDNAATSKENNVVINEVLAYMNVYRKSCSKRKMREVCATYYKDDEIFSAKTLLYNQNPSLLGELINRQDGQERSKGEANIDDMYDWFRKLDDHDISIIICASNIKRIPKFNPEEAEYTSMIERLIKLEESIKNDRESHINLMSRTCKLEEKVFQGAESLENKLDLVKSDLSKTDTQIVKMSNEVQNIDKEIKTQTTAINDQLNAQKSSYSGAVKTFRPTNIRNGTNRQSINNNSNNNNNNFDNDNNNRNDNDIINDNNNQNSLDDGFKQVVRKKRRALVGTARPGIVGTKVMGAPPPSRHFVIERVLNETTKEDLIAHINSRNSEIEIRSLTCMSHKDSIYKKFKLEISVEDCKIVYDPDFWQWGMRVRPFYRKRTIGNEENRFFRPQVDEENEEDS